MAWGVGVVVTTGVTAVREWHGLVWSGGDCRGTDGDTQLQWGGS